MTKAEIIGAAIHLRDKCRRAMSNHRSRARKDGETLNYTQGDLEALAKSQQTCTYCGVPLGWDWQWDHYEPVARSSQAHRLSNLVLCCQSCNKIKGALSGDEFRDLLDLLKTFDPRGAADVRMRLKLGGKARGAFGKKKEARR